MSEETTTGTSLDIIREAMTSKDVDPDKLQKLLDMQQQWDSEEQRKAFHSAIAAFQSNCPIIPKGDMANGRPYARLDRLWRAVRPLLSECGLSVIWTLCEVKDAVCSIEGKLIHRDGYSIDLKRDLPLPDVLSGQNASQRAGSANTYAKRYALCDALGIVTGEDDDANAVGPGSFIDEKQQATLEKTIRELGTEFDKDAFYAWAGCDGLETFPSDLYQQGKGILERRKKKAAELSDGAE